MVSVHEVDPDGDVVSSPVTRDACALSQSLREAHPVKPERDRALRLDGFNFVARHDRRGQPPACHHQSTPCTRKNYNTGRRRGRESQAGRAHRKRSPQPPRCTLHPSALSLPVAAVSSVPKNNDGMGKRDFDLVVIGAGSGSHHATRGACGTARCPRGDDRNPGSSAGPASASAACRRERCGSR